MEELSQLHSFLGQLEGDFKESAMDSHVQTLKARFAALKDITPELATALVERVKAGPWTRDQAGRAALKSVGRLQDMAAQVSVDAYIGHCVHEFWLCLRAA